MEENYFFWGGGEKHALDQRLSVVIIKKFVNIFCLLPHKMEKLLKLQNI